MHAPAKRPRSAVRGTLLATLACIAAAASVAHAETLTLQQCVHQALDQNPDVLVARSQVEQAEGALLQARGHGLPKLTASLTATRTDDALNAFGLKLSQRRATFNDFGAAEFVGPGSLSTAPAALNHPAPVSNYNTRLELQVPLYNGGMVSGYVEQARASVKAAQHGNELARQQVVFQVVQAYQGVHTARAYVQVADQAEKAAEAYVKTTQNLLREGVVVRSDLLSAEVNLADVQVRLEQARRGEAAALDQLHLLLGLPLGTPLDVGPDYAPAPEGGEPVRLADQAVAGNPGLRALRAQLDAAGAAVTVAGADRYPHFNAMLRQDWNDSSLGARAPSYTVAGVLSWQILDFGIVRGGIDRAEASRAELRSRLRQAEDGVRFKVADTWRAVAEAQARIEARQSALGKAEEASRLVQKRYENGVATVVELLAAQAQLDKARADLVAARYELTVQRTGLRLILGQLDEDHL